MKRIKLLIKSYFYYNRQELKGIYILLGLIFIIGLGGNWYGWFFKAEPIAFNVNYLDTLTAQTQNRYYKSNLVSQPLRYKKTVYYPQKNKQVFSNSTSKQTPKTPLNINKADSAQLLALYRIGSKLAGKIINYRNRLGGYYSLQQLTEIYGFDIDILYDLQDQIYVNPNDVKKLNINTAQIQNLSKHPYFKYKLSQAIVNYRKHHGPYKTLQDLKKIKFVTDSIIELIKPYAITENN